MPDEGSFSDVSIPGAFDDDELLDNFVDDLKPVGIRRSNPSFRAISEPPMPQKRHVEDLDASVKLLIAEMRQTRDQIVVYKVRRDPLSVKQDAP